MARRKSPLSWEYDLYTPAELHRMSLKTVKREYNKLRDIMHKRYERLIKHPKYKNIPAAEEYKRSGLKKLSDIGSRDELDRQLTWMAWEIEEGDASIERLQDEERKAKAISDAFMGDSEETDASDFTDEDRGKFWQWIKSKYNNAYLPPSDVTDDMISELMDRSQSEHGRKVIFGQWRSNKRREGEYKIVRA